jgi:hypothetical protein
VLKKIKEEEKKERGIFSAFIDITTAPIQGDMHFSRKWVFKGIWTFGERRKEKCVSKSF